MNSDFVAKKTVNSIRALRDPASEKYVFLLEIETATLPEDRLGVLLAKILDAAQDAERDVAHAPDETVAAIYEGLVSAQPAASRDFLSRIDHLTPRI